MKQRDLYLAYNKTFPADSGTEIHNLDMQDPISQIKLDFTGTNGATSNLGNPLVHNITKVEVVDGSEVLFSMPGHMLRGLDSHLRGRVVSEYPTEVPNDTPIEPLIVPFGRFYNDPLYAFDPRNYRNPQLKITYDFANVRAIGATGFVTGVQAYTCIAQLMGDAPPLKGYLSMKDIYNFTTVASGDEVIDLPTDHPYRALCVRSYEKGVDCVSHVDYIKLSEDGDKHVPFKIETGDLRRLMQDYFGLLEHSIKAYVTDATAVETWMGLSVGGDWNSGTAGYFVGTNYWWLGQLSPFVRLHDNTAGATIVGFVTDRGINFEQCLVIPFGDIKEPSSWYQAQLVNSLKLYLTQNNAGGVANVALQQEVSY